MSLLSIIFKPGMKIIKSDGSIYYIQKNDLFTWVDNKSRKVISKKNSKGLTVQNTELVTINGSNIIPMQSSEWQLIAGKLISSKWAENNPQKLLVESLGDTMGGSASKANTSNKNAQTITIGDIGFTGDQANQWLQTFNQGQAKQLELLTNLVTSQTGDKSGASSNNVPNMLLIAAVGFTAWAIARK